MKKCYYCGQDLNDNANFCNNCGKKLDYADAYPKKPTDKGSFLFVLLGLFFPLFGFILFFFLKKEYPKKAKSCGISALIGIITYFIGIAIFLLLI